MKEVVISNVSDIELNARRPGEILVYILAFGETLTRGRKFKLASSINTYIGKEFHLLGYLFPHE